MPSYFDSVLRPRPRHTSLTAAKEMGCDIVQYKYRGNPCRVVVTRGFARVYDRDEAQIDAYELADERACSHLLGSYFKSGSEPRLVYLFDCLEVGQQPSDALRIDWTDVKQWTYRDRYAMLKQQHALLNLSAHFRLAPCYRLDRAAELWDHPAFFDHACGVVFRTSKAPFQPELYFKPKYKEVPGGLD